MIGFVRMVAYALLLPGAAVILGGLVVLGFGAGALLELMDANPLRSDAERLLNSTIGGAAIVVGGLGLCGPGAVLLAAARMCEIGEEMLGLMEREYGGRQEPILRGEGTRTAGEGDRKGGRDHDGEREGR